MLQKAPPCLTAANHFHTRFDSGTDHERITKMKTCATCKFMSVKSDKWYYGPYDINDIVVDLGHRVCNRILDGAGYETDANKEQAVTLANCNYDSKLFVLPTFGCVLHEVKL